MPTYEPILAIERYVVDGYGSYVCRITNVWNRNLSGNLTVHVKRRVDNRYNPDAD